MSTLARICLHKGVSVPGVPYLKCDSELASEFTPVAEPAGEFCLAEIHTGKSCGRLSRTKNNALLKQLDTDRTFPISSNTRLSASVCRLLGHTSPIERRW